MRSPRVANIQVLAPSLLTILALRVQMSPRLQIMLEACKGLLLQSPHLIRIFQARSLLNLDRHRDIRFFHICILLDISWEDIQGCICYLHSVATEDPEVFYPLLLFLPTLCLDLDCLYPKYMVSRDLACGLIQLMQRIEAQELPMTFW